MERLTILSLLIILSPVFVFAEGRIIDTGTTALMLTSTTLGFLIIFIKNRLGYDDSLDVFGINWAEKNEIKTSRFSLKNHDSVVLNNRIIPEFPKIL